MDDQLGPDPSDQGTEAWPPAFPHATIDRLLARLRDTDSLDTKEYRDLLLLVGQEAERLRSTVVRLALARLSAAEDEAHTIRVEAETQASALRTAALETVNSRLDEADRLMAAVRSALPRALAEATHPASDQ